MSAVAGSWIRLAVLHSCVCVLLFSQQAPPGAERLLLRMRPAGPDGNKKALRIMADLFEPTRVSVPSGTTVDQLSVQACGRIDHDWIASARKANPVLGTGTALGAATILDLPPCPFWRPDAMITVPAIGTLSHRLLNQLGTAGRRTMDKVAELNALSTD